MNRRDFVRRMFGLAVTVAAHPFIPLPRTAYQKLAEHASLYGVPYHMSDATAGTWMGITRSETPMWTASYKGPGRPIDKEVMIAIKKMMETAMNDMRNNLDKEYFK